MPAMIGYSYAQPDGATQGWEAMRIEMIDGTPAFIAMPGGGAGVRFTYTGAIVLDWAPDHLVIFENAAHDYPQRISYAREGNRLTATISKLDGSDAIAFEYRRVRCAANLRP